MWWRKEYSLECVGTAKMEEKQTLEIYRAYALGHLVCESGEGEREEMGGRRNGEIVQVIRRGERI
jgi:hypothetical protein